MVTFGPFGQERTSTTLLPVYRNYVRAMRGWWADGVLLRLGEAFLAVRTAALAVLQRSRGFAALGLPSRVAVLAHVRRPIIGGHREEWPNSRRSALRADHRISKEGLSIAGCKALAG